MSWKSVSAKFIILPFLALGLGLTASGCSRQKSVTFLNSKDPSIFGGRDVTSKEFISKFVVGIHIYHPDSDGWSTCSGTLIGSQIVLTAAHCAEAAPENIRVMFGNSIDGASAAQTRRVAKKAIYDGYVHDDSNTGDRTDIAILKLNKPAPSSSHTMDLPEATFDMSPGAKLMIAGFGAKAYLKASHEAIDADRILRLAVISLSDRVMPDVLTFDQSLGTGSCRGDSGGPAFIQNNGGKGYTILGLLIDEQSYDSTDQGCTGWSHYMDLRQKLGWINDQISNL